MEVGDLVVYAWKPASGLPSIGEEYGLGIILDENPYYYFISWSNICSDSPILATIKENVIPATIENVQQIRAVVETEKELDKWAII